MLLIDTPGGSPVAVKEGEYPDALSVACTWRPAALPMAVAWFAGDVTVTVPGTSQTKLTVPVEPGEGFVPVTTTLYAPGVAEMVPVIWPAGLIVRPGGQAGR